MPVSGSYYRDSDVVLTWTTYSTTVSTRRPTFTEKRGIVVPRSEGRPSAYHFSWTMGQVECFSLLFLNDTSIIEVLLSLVPRNVNRADQHTFSSY